MIVNLLVGLEATRSYFKPDSSSCLISISEDFSSLQVKVGDLSVSVLHSCFSPGTSTFLLADRYSCRKSSNSSSFISSFTDISSCDGSVDPDISDFSSVSQRKS